MHIHLQRIALVCLSVMAATVIAPERASGFEIRVRGQGKLYADVQAAGISVQVAGILRDEVGQALPQRQLKVSIARDNSTARTYKIDTDMQGRFQFKREMTPGTYMVKVIFDQTEHLDGATVFKSVTLKPATYKLFIQAPSLIVGKNTTSSLRVRATANGVGVSQNLELYVNDRQVDDLALDHYGRGLYPIAKHLKPGQNKVRAVLVGNGRRRGSVAETAIRYASAAQIKAKLSEGHQRLERGLRVSGEVFDEIGPLTSGSVFVEFKPLNPAKKTDVVLKRVETKVDDEGKFNGFVGQQHLEDGKWQATVIYEPEVGKGATLTTNTTTLDRSTSRWTLHMLGLLTILIGLVVLAQRSLWSKLAEALSSLWKKDPKDAPLEFQQTEFVEAHVVEEVPEDLGAPSFDAVAGYLWDVWRGEVVPFGKLTVLHDQSQVSQLEADANGRFAMSGLPEGQLTLQVQAPGFATSKLSLKMPHEGQLRYIRVDLVAMALKIRRFYQSWVRRWHGEEVWGKLTPRQIESALFESLDVLIDDPNEQRLRQDWAQQFQTYLDQTAPTEHLSVDHLMALMTALIEESYFSQRTYEERVWQLFVQMTKNLERQLQAARQEVRR